MRKTEIINDAGPNNKEECEASTAETFRRDDVLLTPITKQVNRHGKEKPIQAYTQESVPRKIQLSSECQCISEEDQYNDPWDMPPGILNNDPTQDDGASIDRHKPIRSMHTSEQMRDIDSHEEHGSEN